MYPHYATENESASVKENPTDRLFLEMHLRILHGRLRGCCTLLLSDHPNYAGNEVVLYLTECMPPIIWIAMPFALAKLGVTYSCGQANSTILVAARGDFFGPNQGQI